MIAYLRITCYFFFFYQLPFFPGLANSSLNSYKDANFERQSHFFYIKSFMFINSKKKKKTHCSLMLVIIATHLFKLSQVWTSSIQYDSYFRKAIFCRKLYNCCHNTSNSNIQWELQVSSTQCWERNRLVSVSIGCFQTFIDKFFQDLNVVNLNLIFITQTPGNLSMIYKWHKDLRYLVDLQCLYFLSTIAIRRHETLLRILSCNPW